MPFALFRFVEVFSFQEELSLLRCTPTRSCRGKKTYRASDKMLIPFSVGRRGFIKGTIGDGTVSPIACPLCSVEE